MIRWATILLVGQRIFKPCGLTLISREPTDNRSAITIAHLLSFTSPCHDNACEAGMSKLDCMWNYIYPNCTDSVSGEVFHYGGGHMEIFAQIAINTTGLSTWAKVCNDENFLVHLLGCWHLSRQCDWSDSRICFRALLGTIAPRIGEHERWELWKGISQIIGFLMTRISFWGRCFWKSYL